MNDKFYYRRVTKDEMIEDADGREKLATLISRHDFFVFRPDGKFHKAYSSPGYAAAESQSMNDDNKSYYLCNDGIIRNV